MIINGNKDILTKITEIADTIDESFVLESILTLKKNNNLNKFLILYYNISDNKFELNYDYSDMHKIFKISIPVDLKILINYTRNTDITDEYLVLITKRLYKSCLSKVNKYTHYILNNSYEKIGEQVSKGNLTIDFLNEDALKHLLYKERGIYGTNLFTKNYMTNDLQDHLFNLCSNIISSGEILNDATIFNDLWKFVTKELSGYCDGVDYYDIISQKYIESIINIPDNDLISFIKRSGSNNNNILELLIPKIFEQFDNNGKLLLLSSIENLPVSVNQLNRCELTLNSQNQSKYAVSTRYLKYFKVTIEDYVPSLSSWVYDDYDLPRSLVISKDFFDKVEERKLNDIDEIKNKLNNLKLKVK